MTKQLRFCLHGQSEKIMIKKPLESERLTLRLPQFSDLSTYIKYCGSSRTKYVGGPFNRRQAFEKLSAMSGHWHLRSFGRLIFVEKATNKPIGHVGASQLDDADVPDFTWTIWDSANEEKGFALEACVKYRSYAAEELQFQSLVARIMPENTRSIRLAKKLGGKLNSEISAPSRFPNMVSYEINLAESV